MTARRIQFPATPPRLLRPARRRPGCPVVPGAANHPARPPLSLPFPLSAPRFAPASRAPRPRRARAFTLLEILLALALVALLLLAMNTFVFSMAELWGQRSEPRLFDQHVRAVTRFLEQELRASALPPAARANSTPIAPQEIRPRNGAMEKMLTFELPAGSRLFHWPERPLPEVVCSFQARSGEGLVLLWHSRLEKNFDTDSPRETVVTPLVTALAYDYYDADTQRWSTEASLKSDQQGQPMAPQRLRLKFAYGKLTREALVSLPTPGEGLPVF